MAIMPSSWMSAGGAGRPGRQRTAAGVPARAGMRLMALEPRMLFDGAGAATVDAVKTVEPPCTDANTAPVAHADSRDVQASVPLTDGCAVGGNTSGDVADTDADGDALTVVAVSAGLTGAPSDCDVGKPVAGCYGTLQIQSDGSYTYTPNDNLALCAGDTVQDVFSYQVSDGRGATSTTSITLVVHGVDCNAAPDARDDTRNLPADSAISDGQAIRGNTLGDQADSDPEGGALWIKGAAVGVTTDTLYGQVGEQLVGSYGTLVIQSDGSYAYTPSQAGRALTAGQTAQDVFSYTVADPACSHDNATITINLVGVQAGGNHQPDANNDARVVGAGGSINNGQAIAGDAFGDVADTDADGDTLHVTGLVAGQGGGTPGSGVDQPVHGSYGTLTINGDGSYTYLPDAGLNPAPGQPLQDVFTYGVTDGRGGTDNATLTISISQGNHAPTAVWDYRYVFQGDTIQDGQAIRGDDQGDRADSDPDGDPLTVVGVSAGFLQTDQSGNVGRPIAGQWGTLVLAADGSYTYTPNDASRSLGAGETFRDAFTYTIRDPGGLVSTAWIKIDVIGANDAPQANPDARHVDKGQSISNGQAILGDAFGDRADTDTDHNDVLTVVGVAAGDHGGTPVDGSVGAAIVGQWGTLTLAGDGSYVYVPGSVAQSLQPGDHASDVFTYTISDGHGGTDTTTITIVLAGSDALAARPDSRQTDEDHSVSGNVVSGTAPGENADIDDSGHPITVQGVGAGTSGGLLTTGVGSAVAGNYGTLTLGADGAYTYVPGAAAQALGAGQSADDVFSYSINDGHGNVSTTTLTIHVNGLNDAPVANADVRHIDKTGSITDGQAILGNAFGDRADTDTDPNDVLTVVGVAPGISGGQPVSGSVGQPVSGQWGTLTLNGDGSYTYVPGSAAQSLQLGDHVNDIFTYTISDGHGGTSTTAITVAVSGGDGLTALPDVRSTDENHPVSGNVVLGDAAGDVADIDDSGHPIAVQGAAAGSSAVPLSGGAGLGTALAGNYGRLTINADGSYTYVPGSAAQALHAGQSVDDVFTYSINDGHGNTSTTTLTIHVAGIDDVPTANADTNSINSDATAPATGNVIANGSAGDRADTDTDPGETLTVTGVRPGSGAGANTAPGQPVAGQFGQLTVNPDGSYSYSLFQTNPAVAGLTQGNKLTDTFTYTIRDTGGATSSATVTVVINGVSGGGAGAAPPVVAPLLLPIVPSGFTGSVTNGAGAPVPQLTEVSVKPTPDYRFLLPPDTGNPFGIERVKGVVEEAPTRSTSTTEERAGKTVKRDDDCVPAPRKMVAAHTAVKPADKPSLFAKPALEKPKGFSEQLKHAQKRLRLPAKVAPRPVQRVC